MNRALFSSATDEWATPRDVYESLDAEFGFVDDPCPLGGDVNGLMREWRSPCFVNPPYSNIPAFMEKAVIEWEQGKTVVLLIPSRTDTRWWHRFVMRATEIRFIKGRLRFGGSQKDAPFPSAIVVFQGRNTADQQAQETINADENEVRAQNAHGS
jgi:phage N-6-adenine-methyltransferase